MVDRESAGERIREPVVLAVIGVTVLGLIARFLLLGQRVAHWDEGRVAYWILDYARTGTYYYRPIIHGPFFHHVNSALFSVLGANDFVMRIVPALIGGLLPLSALLFRARLRDSELVALSLFLAANPILLYYSRFMRGDIVVAAFMFVAFALAVRGIDTGQRWYLLPAAVAVALGLTAKENALVYLLTWGGALVLLLDHRFLRARDGDQSWGTLAAAKGKRVVGVLRSSVRELAVSVVAFFVVIVLFYAPRGSIPSDGSFYRYCGGEHSPFVSTQSIVGFDRLLADPGAILDVIAFATVGSWDVATCKWVGNAVDGGNEYLPFLTDLVGTVGYGGAAIAVLAVIGFITDRYGGDRPRDLPMFATYWGVASLLGYPLITDIKAPWAAVHVVLPLTIPAAIGVALIYRWGLEALADDDRVSVAVAFGLLVLVSGQVIGAAAFSSYVEPQSPENQLVQYAQPSGDMRATLEEMSRRSTETEGADVLAYGDYFVSGQESAPRKPACVQWFNALPLPWYWAKDDVNVTCAGDDATFDRVVEQEQPTMVIARAEHQDELAPRLDGYEPRRYLLRSFDTDTVIFVKRE